MVLRVTRGVQDAQCGTWNGGGGGGACEGRYEGNNCAIVEAEIGYGNS